MGDTFINSHLVLIFELVGFPNIQPIAYEIPVDLPPPPSIDLIIRLFDYSIQPIVYEITYSLLLIIDSSSRLNLIHPTVSLYINMNVKHTNFTFRKYNLDTMQLFR